MDTKAVSKEITLIAIGDYVAQLNPELVEELKLEDHEEESFDPRNRTGLCSNS